jgi:outer membrane protein insertion porin family
MVIFRLDAYGGPLGGNRSYTKYSLDLRNYITFFKNITLASRINGGFISGWSNDYDQYETILFEKFYLGGSNTLRAIRPLRLLNYNNDKFDNDGDGLIDEEDEDSNIPTGTEIMTLTNVEVRFPIMWKLGGVLFFDGGNVYLDSKNIRFDSLVWNYGLALTLNLPVGPIRIDYARDSLNPKIYQIQLGFLYAF